MHGEGLLPGREPGREMGGKAATSWGAPCSAKHTACVNPKRSLQKRKLQREKASDSAGEKRSRREGKRKLV